MTHNWSAEPTKAQGKWHRIICREGCSKVLVMSVKDLTDGETENAARHYAAWENWYPLNRYDWLCPHCGWARVLRRDVRALEAEREAERLRHIEYAGRAA